MVSTPGRKPARKLSRTQVTALEPEIVHDVADKIRSTWSENFSIRHVRHCDLAVIITLTLRRLVERINQAEDQEVAA